MLNFNGYTSPNQYYTGPAITTPNGDHFFMFVFEPTDIPTTDIHYILSTGTPLAANTLNFIVNGSGLWSFNYYGASANVASSVQLGETGKWLIVAQREGSNFNLYAAQLGGPMQLLTSVSAASLGSVALSAMRIGGRIDGAAQRWFNGNLHQMAYGTGALSLSQMQRINSGESILTLPGVTTLLHYRDDNTSGSAPATLSNLANPGVNNATLTSGTPLSVANPVYGDYTVTVSGDNQTAIAVASNNVSIGRFTVNVTSSNTGVESRGIYNPSYNNMLIDGAQINFNCPAGHAARLGSFGGPAITGGEFRNLDVRGPTYPVSTPHGITVSTGTNAKVKNNKVRGLHVGILMSNCNGIETGGNILIDNNGPAMYMKGVVNATPARDIIISTGAVTNTNNGLLAAVDAEGINCTAGDFSEQTLIVLDPSKIKAFLQLGGLAAATSTPQPVTFTRIKIITVDTWDPNGAPKFIYTGSLGANPNYTWDQWRALSSSVSNTLEQYPARIVREAINDYTGGLLGVPTYFPGIGVGIPLQ